MKHPVYSFTIKNKLESAEFSCFVFVTPLLLAIFGL